MKYLLVIVLLLGCRNARTQSANDYLRQGLEAYEKQDFRASEEAFRFAVAAAPEAENLYNLANALYQQARFGEAQKVYQRALAITDDRALSAKIHHNLGHIHYQDGAYKEAVGAFKQSLRQSPGDRDSQYNLSVALRALDAQREQEETSSSGETESSDEPNDDQGQAASNQEPQEEPGADSSEGGGAGSRDSEASSEEPGKQGSGEQIKSPEQGMNAQQARQLLEVVENKEKQAQQQYRRGKRGSCYTKKRY